LSVLATTARVLRGRPFWAGMAWVLGVLTKLSAIVLGLQLLVAIVAVGVARNRPVWWRLLGVVPFAVGSAVGTSLLLAPEVTFGSIPDMLHNVLQRTQGGLVVAGLTVFGIRRLRPWSWLLLW